MVSQFNKLLLAATIAVLTPNEIFAQFTFVKGYIVNEKGDTLRGEV